MASKWKPEPPNFGPGWGTPREPNCWPPTQRYKWDSEADRFVEESPAERVARTVEQCHIDALRIERDLVAHDLLLGKVNNYAARRRLRFFLKHGQVYTFEGRRCLAVPCHWCHWLFSWKVLTYDHVVPRVVGGANRLDNLVPACGPCNWQRGQDWLDSPAGRAHVRRVRESYAQLRELNKRRDAAVYGGMP